MHIGKAILKELKKQKQNQSWLAEKIKFTRQGVSAICQKESIGSDLLIKIAKALNVEPADLLK